MKKLMIASAALCAAVCASAVESQNVVGYAQPAVGDNANLASAPFAMVGSDGMDIQQIVPSGDGMYGGAVTMKLLQSDLSDDVEYVYLPAEEAPNGVAGWYDDGWSALITKTFGTGEGFIIMNGLPNGTVRYAGEVMVGKPTWELAPNANLAGNVSPVNLDIQDIKVGTAVDVNGDLTDENDDIYGGCMTIKLLQSDLSDDVEYVYLPAGEAPNGVAGWYDDGWGALITETFAPGDGFIIMSGLAAGFAQIPAALTAN